MTHTLTVTRPVADWVGVIQALEIMGFNEPLIERIRLACRAAGPNASDPVALVFEGKDIHAVDLATNAADHGRPSYFPPVFKDAKP